VRNREKRYPAERHVLQMRICAYRDTHHEVACLVDDQPQNCAAGKLQRVDSAVFRHLGGSRNALLSRQGSACHQYHNR
jgi:hypothetical protein